MKRILRTGAFVSTLSDRSAKLRRSLATAGVAALMMSGSGFLEARAADIAEERFDDPEPVESAKRNWSLTPYLWMVFFSGDMTVNGQTVDMTGASMFDMLDAGRLNFPPLVLLGEWDGDGRWGVIVDGTLVGLNFSSGQLSLGPGPLTAELGMDFTYGLVNAGVTYTAHEWQSHGFNSELDFIGGVRYTYYDLDLNGRIGPAPVTLSETLNWVDAIIGARVRGYNDNGVTYSAYLDIGAGGGFSVQGLATIGKTWKYQTWDLNVFGGYRVLYQDWSGGNDAVDLTIHGPLLGLRFIF